MGEVRATTSSSTSTDTSGRGSEAAAAGAGSRALRVALARGAASRPRLVTDALFVSRSPAAPPQPVSAGAVGDIVATHAAAAGVRDDRRSAHALRHTFCTMLAERGVAMEVIRALAGHVDIPTTQIYVDVTDERKADGTAPLEHVASVRPATGGTGPPLGSRSAQPRGTFNDR